MFVNRLTVSSAPKLDPLGTEKPATEKPGINVLAICKGEERYVFLFDDNNAAEVLRVFGRFASDPELSFTWYEAAILSQRVRKNCLGK